MILNYCMDKDIYYYSPKAPPRPSIPNPSHFSLPIPPPLHTLHTPTSGHIRKPINRPDIRIRDIKILRKRRILALVVNRALPARRADQIMHIETPVKVRGARVGHVGAVRDGRAGVGVGEFVGDGGVGFVGGIGGGLGDAGAGEEFGVDVGVGAGGDGYGCGGAGGGGGCGGGNWGGGDGASGG